MFEGLFQPVHLLLILGIALVVMGPDKLPQLGASLGRSIRELRNSMQSESTPESTQDIAPQTHPDQRS